MKSMAEEMVMFIILCSNNGDRALVLNTGAGFCGICNIKVSMVCQGELVVALFRFSGQ